MFCISNNLTKPEALTFASTLRKDEECFLIKVFENPKERHIAKREKYVVVRHVRQGETVVGAYKKVVKENQLSKVMQYSSNKSKTK